MRLWIRVQDGFVNSSHVVRIVEDANNSVLHLVDGTTAIADDYPCSIVARLHGEELPSIDDDDDDSDLPF